MDEIKASDLALLMKVVDKATGLYNVLEAMGASTASVHSAQVELGDALRELGLREVDV